MGLCAETVPDVGTVLVILISGTEDVEYLCGHFMQKHLGIFLILMNAMAWQNTELLMLALQQHRNTLYYATSGLLISYARQGSIYLIKKQQY